MEVDLIANSPALSTVFSRPAKLRALIQTKLPAISQNDRQITIRQPRWRLPPDGAGW